MNLPRKVVILWLIVGAAMFFVMTDFLAMRGVSYDFQKASSVAENLLAQHLRDVKETREKYGEPEVSIWQGDALVVFKSVNNPEEEIIVSLGKDGSVTLSLSTPPEDLLKKVMER